MGYDIYIGNIEMRQLDEDDDRTTKYLRVINGKTVYFKPTVKKTHQQDAPIFPNDDMTGNGNDRHPGYSAWSEFLRKTGLLSLFFDEEDGLMREHPGCFPLRNEHAAMISQALEAWKQAYPDAVPGFEAFSWRGEELPVVGYDPILARLIWLDWWVRWALTNCETPGIYNF